MRNLQYQIRICQKSSHKLQLHFMCVSNFYKTDVRRDTFYPYLEVNVTHKPQEIRLISVLDCLCGTLQQFFYPMVFLFSASYLCLPEGQAVLQLQLENTICSHHLPSCKLVQKLAAAHVCMKLLLLLIYKAKCIQLCPTNKVI